MNAQRFYSNAAAMYDLGLRLNGYKGAANYIAAQLPFSVEDRFTVLDAGAGTGLYSLAILKRFPNAQVTAFDLNPEMIEKMNANLKDGELDHRATARVGNVLEKTTVDGQQFDLVVTGGLFEYVDIDQAVRNLVPFVRSNGYYLNSPVRNHLLGKIIGKSTGFWPYPMEKNLSVFADNGLALQQSIDIPLRYFPICFVKKAHIFKKP